MEDFANITNDGLKDLATFDSFVEYIKDHKSRESTNIPEDTVNPPIPPLVSPERVFTILSVPERKLSNKTVIDKFTYLPPAMTDTPPFDYYRKLAYPDIPADDDSTDDGDGPDTGNGDNDEDNNGDSVEDPNHPGDNVICGLWSKERPLDAQDRFRRGAKGYADYSGDRGD